MSVVILERAVEIICRLTKLPRFFASPMDTSKGTIENQTEHHPDHQENFDHDSHAIVMLQLVQLPIYFFTIV